ncbi:MAG: hypothetical protein SNF33_06110 [Candidatus Algichlamydia australiensis]|nr:hypothetical protein [Chlamydiales bacterium]
MVYISGPSDTLGQLKEIDGYQGSLEEYCQKFNTQNGTSYLNTDARLLPYYPYILISEPPIDVEGAQEAVSVIKNFPEEVRERMRLMQVEGIDMLTHLALSEVFDKARRYADSARSWMDEPLITTPWNFINVSLTNQSAIDLVTGALPDVTEAILKSSFPYDPLHALSFHMMEMDKSNRELARLNLIKGRDNDPNFFRQKEQLRESVKMHKLEIKRILPASLDSELQKFLRKIYTPDVIRKIRNGVLSSRLARKGAKSSNSKIQARSVLSELQFMTKTGLETFEKRMAMLKTVGGTLGSTGTFLSYGLVAYDTERAYHEGDGVMKTFFSEMAGLEVSAYMSAAVTSRVLMGVSAIAGEELLVGGAIVCAATVGWVVVLGAGLLAAGYVGAKATGIIQYLWEPENRKEVWEEVKANTHAAEKHIIDAWDTSRDWVRHFYAGSDE